MAIQTKAKNCLLLPVTDGGVTQPFNMPGFAGYNKSKTNHNGLDLGWTKTQYCNVLACQDGKVVDVYSNNASFGNGIVLQHDYDDGTHRWTGYVHLRDQPKLKKGDSVKQGATVGIRGGSPYVDGKAKYGVHLHLYVTKAVKDKYSWNTMKANVIDPYPLLYKSKAVKYNVLSTSDKAMMNTLKYLEDVIPEVVPPVERDIMKNQLLEKSNNLRVRMSPSLKGTIIGYLQANEYYDYFEEANADNYKWYQIAEAQWCAQTSTMEVYPGKTELDLLKEENEQLKAQVSKMTDQLERINKITIE